jgi:class 3 adenylate cyclase
MADERKLATILFADLVGSTAAADDQDPERTRARLERFYDAMTAEIEAAGGTVEKFAGDAVMAAFGAPGALEDHAERALHAALAMQRQVDGLRIGVNTGEVVVGRPREGSSFVSGDAVNVAARLEQGAEPGEILVGERAVAAAHGAFEFGEQRTLEAKGKPGGIPCRNVLRALTLMRPRGVGGLAPAFVGRDDELGRLRAAFQRTVEHSRPVVVTVVGDAGVGKTRLARELWELLANEESEPLRRTGRCLPYGQGITYWPFAEVLKEHLGIRENDSPEEVRRMLGDREILGLTLGLDVAGDLHPLAARDRLHAAWIELLSQLTSERPVVILIEDVHWAEQPLLDLLERLGREVRGPLLLLTSARPDFMDNRTVWSGRVDAEAIWLEPLPAGTAGSLIDTLVAGELPAHIRELVVERAEGNPFFVEEILASLIDTGMLVRRNGGWEADEMPPGYDIPDSVQAVLAARIDLLDEPEKAALQAAAVIGRVFWTGPVYELVEGLSPDLHALETRDFIRQRQGSSLEGEIEYVFKHALTREVAYAGLTKPRRAGLHAAFAAWIERFGEGREEHAPLLAHHYAESVRPDDVDVAWPDGGPELDALRAKAVLWLRRAGEGAISRYDLDDAAVLFARAVELEPDPAEQSRLLRRQGRAQALKYDGDSFMQTMESALALATDPKERAETYAELAFESAGRSGMWRRRPTRESMEEWTTRALAGVEYGTAAHVKTLFIRAFWELADADESAVLASELAEKLGDVGLRSCAWDARAVTSFRRGDFEAALTWEMRRFDFIDQLNDPDLVHDLYLSTVPTTAAVGRLGEARRLAKALDDHVAALTSHHRVHGIASVLEVEELVGDWEAIVALETRAEQAVEENSDTPCIRNSRSLLLCALAHECLGRTDRSRELEEHAATMEGEGYGATLATPRARIALARSDLARLEELLHEKEWLIRMSWFSLPAVAVRLDAGAVFGDPESVRKDADHFGRPRSYLEPFALRAQAIVTEDDALLAQAHDRFNAMRLDWHLAQTSALVELRKQAH